MLWIELDMVTDTEKGGGYPCFFIIRNSMGPVDATLATADPCRHAKKVLSRKAAGGSAASSGDPVLDAYSELLGV